MGRALEHRISKWSTHMVRSGVVFSFTPGSIGICMIGVVLREGRTVCRTPFGRVVGRRSFTWHGLRTIARLREGRVGA